jgi:DNA (cytosine-5)-methyltransferase 1
MEAVTVGDTFSGLGAMKLAFKRAGAATVWSSEVNRQSISVYRRHHPEVEQLGDIKHVGKHNAAPVTVICGGSPCQNFSQAGDRTGLEGKESGLFREYIRVIKELRPAFAVWENVYGVLSSNGGRDFAAILAAFRECGARDIAWRTLDAQFAGVPQRRRRVFLVADFRADRAGKILFEPESAYGDSPARKEAGADIAYALTGSNQRLDASNNETFIGIPDIARPISTVNNKSAFDDGTKQTLIGVAAVDARNGKVDERVTSTLQDGTTLNSMPLIAGTLRANGSGLQYASTNIPGDYLVPEKAFSLRVESGVSKGLQAHNSTLVPSISGTLMGSGAGSARPAGQKNELDFLIPDSYRVRRLMPIECERLQGFPDGYTQYGHDGRELTDTPRYRMLGNSIAVPVIEWIARRMVEVLS